MDRRAIHQALEAVTDDDLLFELARRRRLVAVARLRRGRHPGPTVESTSALEDLLEKPTIGALRATGQSHEKPRNLTL